MITRTGEALGASSIEPLHERLRHRRLSVGLDLEALSRETKIQLRYFEAIELGQVHLLPQGVYMRNFIRIYLRSIGMENPSEIQNIIDTLTSGVLRLPTAANLANIQPRPEPAVPVRTLITAAAAMLILALAGFALWWFILRDVDKHAPPTAPATSVAQPTPAPQATPAPRDASAAMAPSLTPVPSPPAEIGVTVSLRANKRAWLNLTGKTAGTRPMSLKNGESIEVYLPELTTIEVSQPGAVELSIKGQSVPASRLQKSRYLKVDPSNLAELFTEMKDAPKDSSENSGDAPATDGPARGTDGAARSTDSAPRSAEAPARGTSSSARAPDSSARAPESETKPDGAGSRAASSRSTGSATPAPANETKPQ